MRTVSVCLLVLLGACSVDSDESSIAGEMNEETEETQDHEHWSTGLLGPRALGQR